MPDTTGPIERPETLAPAPGDPARIEAFIPTPCVQNHASFLMPLPGGDLGMVTYRGTQPALTDLMSGNVPLLIDNSFALLPATGDGKVRALGIATKDRSALAPTVPTMAEAGLPGYEFQSWYGVWAPKGTPAEICQQVNALMQETMRDRAVVQRLSSQVLEPVTESIAETRQFIAGEIARATELLRSVNYQPE